MGSTAQGLPLAGPVEMGFSAERLRRINAGMQRYIDSGQVPGTVTLVARHGHVVHLEAQGWSDVEARKPMAVDTLFRIASMTKLLTCVSVLMLYEEGHFLLDTPISKFLPAFKNPVVRTHWGATVPASREITFRDCLTHTAGFSQEAYRRIMGRGGELVFGPAPRDPWQESAPEGAPAKTVRDWVDWLAKMPLDFQPGANWEYHPGHDVAGVLVEVISGQTLDEFFRERITGPLGMVDTHFFLPEEKVSRLSAGYAVDERDVSKIKLVDAPATSEKVVGPKTFFSGGGGLVSTAADYARFAQMLLNGGVLDGARLLSPKSVELMTTNHTGDIDIYLRGPGYGYGLGFFVRTSLSESPLIGTVGTYGWGGAFATWYFADPKEDLFGLLMTQVRGYPQNPNLVIRPDFERLVYQALVGG